MIDLPGPIIHTHLLQFLGDKDLARLSQTCRALHIRVIADKSWEELVKARFTARYNSIYSNLASHTFYRIYCVEAMFSILDKKAYDMQWYDKKDQECLNANGNICLWFTFTMPMIKCVAVILRATKTGNLIQAINTIL